MTASGATLVHVGQADSAPTGTPTTGRVYVTAKATALIAFGAAVLGGIVGWIVRDSQAEEEEREREERRRRRRAA